MYMRPAQAAFVLSDEEEAKLTTLIRDVGVHKESMYKKLFDPGCLRGWQHPSAEKMNACVEFLVEHNTSYKAWNVPRMVGLTSDAIKRFYARMDEQVRELYLHGTEGEGPTLVTALVHTVEDLPPTLFKLQKAGKEQWVRFGLV